MACCYRLICPCVTQTHTYHVCLTLVKGGNYSLSYSLAIKAKINTVSDKISLTFTLWHLEDFRLHKTYLVTLLNLYVNDTLERLSLLSNRNTIYGTGVLIGDIYCCGGLDSSMGTALGIWSWNKSLSDSHQCSCFRYLEYHSGVFVSRFLHLIAGAYTDQFYLICLSGKVRYT